MKNKTEIIKDPENEITAKVLEQSILDVANGMKKLRSGRLNDRAIVLLVQHAAGTTSVTQAQVKLVLDAVKDLDKAYLK